MSKAQETQRDKRRRAEMRGHLAEKLVFVWFILKGYRILAHRFKTPVGEIDLIARRGRTLACIEIKQRATFDLASLSISQHQQHRIMRAGLVYQQRNKKLMPLQLRFDAVFVVPWRFPRHIPNAWDAQSLERL